MKFSEARATESKYVKSEDLQGRRVTVVIESYQKEVIGQGNDAKEKLILYFQGKTKGMVCNVTNGERLADMFGDEMDGWIGREIVLATERVPFQGRMVPGLRVSRAGPPPRTPVTQVHQPDPIEEMTGAPTRNHTDEEIPW